jgi:microcystin-dependent protein
MNVGDIILYGGITIPTGFHVCDGSELSREDYSELFDIIGTTYGPGDGSTTFNLPNLSGKASVGFASGLSIGSSGGEEEHTILESEIPNHVHEVAAHSHANTLEFQMPELTHTVTQPVFKYTQLSAGGNHMGGNGAWSNHYNGRTNRTMSKTANCVVSDHPATACTMSGGVTDCPAFDTESAVLSTPHNNMMPYLSLTYLIYAPETVYEPGMTFYNGCLPVGPSGCYIVGKG